MQQNGRDSVHLKQYDEYDDEGLEAEWLEARSCIPELPSSCPFSDRQLGLFRGGKPFCQLEFFKDDYVQFHSFAMLTVSTGVSNTSDNY